ncbi:MAG TPA: ABC transporter transmembrane domain-containing protein, partial [Pseudonocardiaceae bacterium]|nr:ABC transporter transmembrane domain-containing protein [Pseudonocardiaceae bacterium]
MSLPVTKTAGRSVATAVSPVRPDNQSDIGTLRQLWRFRDYGRAELRSLVLGTAMRGCELAADLAAPWPLALVIDDLLRGDHKQGVLQSIADGIGGSSVAMLLVAAVAVLVITAVSGLFDYLGDRIMNGAGERITSRIRADVFSYVDRLPMGFHDRQSIGELTTRVVQDTGRIEDSLVDLFSTLVPAVLTLVGTGAVLIAVDWRLGSIGLCVAPLVFRAAMHYAQLTRRISRERRAAVGQLTGFVTESLQGMRTIHAFGSQDAQDQRFGRTNQDVLRLGLRSV